jgi:hypothetical protein
MNGSGISSVGIDTDENNAIKGKDLLFEGSEEETFLFLEKCDVIRSHRQIGKVGDVINIAALSSSKKMTVPRMLQVIFLEYMACSRPRWISL